MKTYIWTLPNRIFHWLLAIGFAVAYFLGDYEEYGNWHFAFGAFVGVLLFFRIIFGFIGPKYANFKDFSFGVKDVREFITNYFGNSKEYAGHNPPASMVMTGIFIIGILASFTGFLLYSADTNTFFTLGLSKDILEEVHELFSNFFLGLVIFHLLGVFSDKIFHGKTGTLQSIFKGYKNIKGENAHLNGLQKGIIVIWFLAAFYAFYFAYNLPSIEDNDHKNNIEHYESDDD